MKKGVNNTRIIESIKKGLKLGLLLKSESMKDFVISEYNSQYSTTSFDTIAANLREEAVLHFQDEMFISKVDQDGKGSIDFISAKIVDDVVHIVISQQKGNDASFNSASKSDTLRKLSDIKNGGYKNYFQFLPDELNPSVNGLEYKVDVIIGYTNAVSNKVGKYKCKDKVTNIEYYCGDMYLVKMGIKKVDMIDIEIWVSKQEKINNHVYDATKKCFNFDESYNKCVERFSMAY